MNCTTIEQSKKLRELGVPIESADCIRATDTGTMILLQNCRVTPGYASLYAAVKGETVEPHWTVGQLIEVYVKCVVGEGYLTHTIFFDDISVEEGLINTMIHYFEKSKFDFTKWTESHESE